jgi:crotonobetainyl-CoA:carnitine CoA-transferase CaiB-like acyl-CoA transferase
VVNFAAPGEDIAVLPGLRVLDLADASGLLCGRILADLGADVIKVEPPGGDPGRRAGPFANDHPEVERSLTWLAGNVNKRGITCNLATVTGLALFRQLAAQADVVIESFPPGHLDDLGVGYPVLSSENPGLILTSITPFGADGPRADWPASDLEVSAASGCLWLAGDPGRPPVRNTLPQSPAWSGMYAAVGTLMAVLARDLSGRGQQVDVSAQASLVTAVSHAPIFWDLLRENPARSGPFLTGRSVSGAMFRNIWPCRDGYVTFALYGGPAGRNTARSLVAWMEERGGAPEVLRQFDWDQFDVATVTPETVAELERAIAPFLLTLTRREFFEGVVQRNMLGYSVATTEDIRDDEQLDARGFWQQVAAPWGLDGEQLPFPGSFAVIDGQRLPIRRSAPRLGEHNAEVYSELGLTGADLIALRGAGVL